MFSLAAVYTARDASDANTVSTPYSSETEALEVLKSLANTKEGFSTTHKISADDLEKMLIEYNSGADTWREVVDTQECADAMTDRFQMCGSVEVRNTRQDARNGGKSVNGDVDRVTRGVEAMGTGEKSASAPSSATGGWENNASSYSASSSPKKEVFQERKTSATNDTWGGAMTESTPPVSGGWGSTTEMRDDTPAVSSNASPAASSGGWGAAKTDTQEDDPWASSAPANENRAPASNNYGGNDFSNDKKYSDSKPSYGGDRDNVRGNDRGSYNDRGNDRDNDRSYGNDRDNDRGNDRGNDRSYGNDRDNDRGNYRGNDRGGNDRYNDRGNDDRNNEEPHVQTRAELAVDAMEQAPSAASAIRSDAYTEQRDTGMETALFDDEHSVPRGINFDQYENVPVKVTGNNVPPSVKTFAEANFHPHIIQNVVLSKYTTPTPVQKYGLPVITAGRDLMACAQTGSGKTAAFLLPILSMAMKNGWNQATESGYRVKAKPFALIMAPTRELATQIYDEARKFSYRTGVRPVVVYGGAPSFPQMNDLERGCHLVVATPGRLMDFVERAKISLENIKFLVLDEADRMLDMGFEQSIRKIVMESGMPRADSRQTLMFSATFPEQIQNLAADFMRKDYLFLTVGHVGSACTNITQDVLQIDGRDKNSKMEELLETMGRQRVLIFVNTKRTADMLDDYLDSKGFPTTSIHGDRNQQQREAALWNFRKGKSPILVATDVASRGLDIPKVTVVVNYDMPSTIEDYVHRIGRTARAGNLGSASSFFTSRDDRLAEPLIKVLTDAGQVVPEFLKSLAGGGYGGGGGNSRGYGDARYGNGGGRSSNGNGKNYGGNNSSAQNGDYSSYNQQSGDASEKAWGARESGDVKPADDSYAVNNNGWGVSTDEPSGSSGW